MNTNRNERGQALVLIVLAILGMMAFAALAIDGGMMYAERRRAQNAADAAAYAAALAGVQGKNATEIQTLAENVLKANGYEPGVDMVVEVNKGPESGPYKDNPSYYQVVIDMKIKPMFSQFLFSGGIPMKAEAVARGQGGTTGGSSTTSENVLWGLKKNDTSIRFNGGVTVNIVSGDIYGRGNGDKDGGNDKGTAKAGIYLFDKTGSTIQMSGPSWTGNTDGIWLGASDDATKSPYTPVLNAPVQEDPIILQPVCPTTPGEVDTSNKNNTVYKPGYYKDTIKVNGGGKDVQTTFQPGLYCLENGLTWNGNASIVAKEVLFVNLGGNVKMNGGGKVVFTAGNVNDAGGTPYPGLLFFNAGDGELVLTGGHGTQFYGTIYNPKGTCEFGGNSGTLGYHSNIICNYIWIHGNALVKLWYDKDNLYVPETVAIIDLVQ